MRGNWYLPLGHAADLLGCGRTEVRNLVESGILEFIMMPPDRIKVSQSSLLDFLNGRTAGAESEEARRRFASHAAEG